VDQRTEDASIGQRLLWFLGRYRGENGSLNCPTLCKLRGPLDVEGLQAAISDVVARHESLRTTIVGTGRRLKQVIAATVERPLTVIDLSAEQDPDAAVRSRITDELSTPIDASVDAVRLTLWRLAPEESVLCINMHHFITDSWSCGIVFDDLCIALDRRQGGSRQFAPAAWSYAEFARQQAEDLSGAELRRLSDHWKKQLKGISLPKIPMKPATSSNGGYRPTARVQAALDPQCVEALREQARGWRTTLFVLLLTAYYWTISQLTDQTDITVASLFANRRHEPARRTVGFCANMVLLRVALQPTKPFRDAVQVTHASVVSGFINQALPFQMLPLPSSSTQNRPDDIVFQMLAEPVYTTTSGALEIEVLVPDDVSTRFEIELVVVPRERDVEVIVFYAEDRVDQAVAQSILDNFLKVCRDVATDQPIRLRDAAGNRWPRLAQPSGSQQEPHQEPQPEQSTGAAW